MKDAETFLHRIIRDARLPHGEVSVVHGTFVEALQSAEDTDLNIFGLPETLNLDGMRQVSDSTRTSCLFVMDSGYESALA